jgi:hypothetical protein
MSSAVSKWSSVFQAHVENAVRAFSESDPAAASLRFFPSPLRRTPPTPSVRQVREPKDRHLVRPSFRVNLGSNKDERRGAMLDFIQVK